ncbi:PilZ domain-containing protein [Sulfurimonas sp.]|uniref:PilZ domain-containing protein n=1 Tax=Sulfurimonas sp. TaxID=2022749 RepID=UPI002AB08372|nr:PilZ domain-containing protein [Sulfurimonas sp.]
MIHLYNNTISSSQLKEVVKAFKGYKSIDINRCTGIDDDFIYFVEIDKIKKTLLLKIKELLKNKKKSLIYFFINDSHSLMLFQLASLLEVKNIFTKKNIASKILVDIQKEIKEHQTIQQEHQIAQTIMHDHHFMIFENNKLKFASSKIYKDFNCIDLEDVKSKICSQFNLDALLKEDSSIQNVFKFGVSQELYNIKSSTSDLNQEKFIYIENMPEDNHYDVRGIDFIKNRIYFIETLKEKVLEVSISAGMLGVISIHIENIANLRNDWSEYEIEMSIRDILLQVELEIESHTILAQYDSGLYVTLFQDLDFEALKQKASKIQSHINEYSDKQKIKPLIGLYAFDIHNLELNQILQIISNISKEELSPKDIESQSLYRIINIDDTLDEEKIIDILLQASFTNKTAIKLMNIYKGLCINTSSLIVKKIDQEIYVRYEHLQGTVMHLEKETVLQSSNFPKDIIADVKYVDPKKSIAQLKNFRFVQGSANSRKYSRVTCALRVPISITHDKGTLNGEILDISLNSIAIKTRFSKNINTLKLSKIVLNFTLPIKDTEFGYMQLSLNAKVVFTLCDDEFCKVVLNLYEDQSSEAVLMEYVYARQKEIIVELKKQTAMLQ